MNGRQGKRTGALILAILAWIGPFYGSEIRAEEQIYDIELVVFQNLVENDAGEVWPLDDSAWSANSGEEMAGLSGPEVTWLSKPYRLGAHYEALRRSAQYRPLAHFAWRQPLLDRDQAAALQLPATGAQPGGAYVDGSARVAVERYLHLYLDLRLHGAVPRAPVVYQPDADPEPHAVPEFRLKEKRRMRSKELHYFDNPRFGALALITPYTPDPDGETRDSEASGDSPR
ncbi:MAG: hypothetical protein JSU62_01010 [Gammaproteobacteria bacterium]|nr:MAG: hypothetical protein JSU62_01010 [Gammaproteobacteria bacterium]